MSMWVYNRIICSEKTKEKIIDIDFLKQNKLEIDLFGLKEQKLSNDLYEVRFETHGVEYYDKDIRYLISIFHDIKWLCAEQEFMECGFYYWQDDEIKFEQYKLSYGTGNYLINYMNYAKGFYTYWPHYWIFIEDKMLIIEDIDNNKFYKYKLNDEDWKEIIKICKSTRCNENKEMRVYKSDKEHNEDLKIYIADFELYATYETDNDEFGMEYKEEVEEIKEKINFIIKKYNTEYLL